MAKLRMAQELFDLIYPVGSYYETSNTSWTPQDAGWWGTWVEDSAGRTTVARISASGQLQQNSNTFYGSIRDAELNESRLGVGETFGEFVHTLTVAEMPAHRHKFGSNQNSAAAWSDHGGFKVGSGSYTTLDLLSMETVGGSGVHNNIPPMIVVRRWHRTA